MTPYTALQLMREPDPDSVLLMTKRAGNKQTISPLKQLAKAFQFFRHPLISLVLMATLYKLCEWPCNY